MVGYNRRFSPMLNELKQVYKKRQYPLLMTFRVNAGAVPAGSWVRSAEEGGGRIIGEMCHFIDVMSYLTNAAIQGVKVTAICSNSSVVPREDNTITTLNFDDGSIGAIIYTSMGDRSISKEYLEVYSGGCTAILDNFLRLTVASKGKRTAKRSLRQHKGHHQEVAEFIRAINENQPSPISFESILATTLTTFSIVEKLGE
jgi:polar amino acid transport system substrate-binding protein